MNLLKRFNSIQLDTFCGKIKYAVSVYWTKIVLHSRRKQIKKKNKQEQGEMSISHVTAYCVPNAGDIVLSQCVRDVIERKLYTNIDWNLVDLYSTVDEFAIAGINDTKALVIGGGGLFLPDSNKNNISAWQWACSVQQYDKIDVPVIVFAVGYNYFNGQTRNSLFENNVMALVKKAAFFGLRSRGSVAAIQAFLPDSLKEKVVYQPCPTMVASKIYGSSHKCMHKRVVFNVALDRPERRFGDKKNEILIQIAQAMKHISNMGYEVCFVAHCIQDLQFENYTYSVGFKCKFYNLINWDYQKILDFYNESDVVFGMRSHSVWIPFGMNCVILPLLDQNKNRWFMRDIHCEDLGIEIQSPELQKNIEQHFVMYYVNDYQKTSARLSAAQEELYEITCNNLDDIKHLLLRK